MTCGACGVEFSEYIWPLQAILRAGDDTAEVLAPVKRTRCPSCLAEF